ncbi:MAG: PepSY domain-containing protein [Pseudomonadota bacterium]|nr:PepSY domain-containing protein [Pseudomonadota bacterium]
MKQGQGLRYFGARARAAIRGTLIICCAGLAFAGSAGAADTPPGAKITPDQAAAVALKVMPGKVTEVKVEKKGGKDVYVVEIMTETKGERDVFVDIVTGKVIGTD